MLEHESHGLLVLRPLPINLILISRLIHPPARHVLIFTGMCATIRQQEIIRKLIILIQRLEIFDLEIRWLRPLDAAVVKLLVRFEFVYAHISRL